MKKARKAMQCIRRLTGQLGMCPDACRSDRGLCTGVGAVWGRAVVGRPGRFKSQEPVRAAEPARESDKQGTCEPLNLGVVMAESGLRPAESLLNNRSRRRVLRLISLPRGDQSRTLSGGGMAMGQQMVHFSEYSGRVEEVYLPEDRPIELGASISVADAEWAEQEARRADSQPGLVFWTDGSRDEDGAVGTRWCGRRDGAGPEGRPTWGIFRRHKMRSARRPGRGSGEGHATEVRIFNGAQAAITRMMHDEPGPCQTYALQARKAIAAGAYCRDRDPLVPYAERNPRKQGRGRVGQQAASEPGDHGVEWLSYANKYGRRSMPPASLAYLKRRASEKNWPEARSWRERRQLNKGYVLRKKYKPDPTQARAEKRTASRFHQLKSVTGVYLKQSKNRLGDHCWWCDPENDSGTQQTRDYLFKHCYKWRQSVSAASGLVLQSHPSRLRTVSRMGSCVRGSGGPAVSRRWKIPAVRGR